MDSSKLELFLMFLVFNLTDQEDLINDGNFSSGKSPSFVLANVGIFFFYNLWSCVHNAGCSVLLILMPMYLSISCQYMTANI